MVSDAGEQIHYGYVQLGGYTPFRSLQPDDRLHMFNVERANLVARRSMGAARYMATIYGQHHGVGHGDDADMVGSEEGGESEEREEDVLAEPRTNLSQTVETFWNELNSCLMRHDYGMANQFQNCIMMILDALNDTIPMPQAKRIELFTTLGGSLESMADQTRVMADRYNNYSSQLREMAFVD